MPRSRARGRPSPVRARIDSALELGDAADYGEYKSAAQRRGVSPRIVISATLTHACAEEALRNDWRVGLTRVVQCYTASCTILL